MEWVQCSREEMFLRDQRVQQIGFLKIILFFHSDIFCSFCRFCLFCVDFFSILRLAPNFTNLTKDALEGIEAGQMPQEDKSWLANLK